MLKYYVAELQASKGETGYANRMYRTSSTAPQTGRSWVSYPKVSFEFFIDIILPAVPWL